MPRILYMLREVTSDVSELTFRQIGEYLLRYVEYLGWYPERDLNPHDRNWPREFKSLVSTDSTIWATALRAACDELKAPPHDKGTEKKRLEIRC